MRLRPTQREPHPTRGVGSCRGDPLQRARRGCSQLENPPPRVETMRAWSLLGLVPLARKSTAVVARVAKPHESIAVVVRVTAQARSPLVGASTGGTPRSALRGEPRPGLTPSRAPTPAQAGSALSLRVSPAQLRRLLSQTHSLSSHGAATCGAAFFFVRRHRHVAALTAVSRPAAAAPRRRLSLLA